MTPEIIAIAHRSLSLTESAFLNHYQQGRFQFRDGVAFTGSELPGPGFNFAACLGPCPPLAEVTARGREFFAKAESGWGILVEGGAAHPMEAEILAAGWAVAEDEPAFVLTPLTADSIKMTSNPPQQITIRPAQSLDDVTAFKRVCTIAFDAPPEIANLIMPSLAFATDPEMGWFLTEKNGEAIACGGYHRSEKTAVICCLATLPEFRGQGVGEAISKFSLAHALERGCTNASLRSGPKSIPLYQRVGFQYACQHRTYAAPTV